MEFAMKEQLVPLGFVNPHVEFRGGKKWGLVVIEKPRV